MADNHSDANRLLAIKTVLQPDVLLVNRFTANEAVSRLFHFDLELMSPLDRAGAVKPSALIGASASVRLQTPDGSSRFFHGLFSRFEEGSQDREFRYYRAELSPWLWLLTMVADCRVFQGQTVPEIIMDVFREHGQLDFLDLTTRSYPKWDCCIQYRETSFDFVSRLMEHEGIFYFFQHEEDKHVLSFADRLAGPYDNGEAPAVRYDLETGHNAGERIVTSWTRRDILTPGRYVTRDFHYGLAKKSLEFGEKTISPIGNNESLEVYDFPGEYAPPFNEKDRFGEVEQEGERLARIRMEEEEAAQVVFSGSSIFHQYRTAFQFQLTGHPNLNGAFVPLAIQHSVEQAASHFHEAAVPNAYTCALTCAKLGLPFRPPRVTRRPVMQGPQTATVVGPEKSEIHTDEFGRVKVHFHWDRKRDGLGLWVRVGQIWAGPGWGAQFIPRVGHEVIVDFIEGDPDQPIVIGSVYNSANSLPYELTAQQTQSGIKTRSSPQGGAANFNEIRFEDKKGQERLVIHAERSMSESVEASQTITVGGNRSITTGGEKDGVKHGDVKELVHKNHNLHVKGDARSKVDGKCSQHVVGDVAQVYDANASIGVGQKGLVEARELYLQASDKIVIVCGGSSIVIDTAGVTIVGSPNIKLNCPGPPPMSAVQNLIDDPDAP